MSKKSANGAAAPAVIEPADEAKVQLDLAWTKIQNALQQEAEGCNLWIEGTLELIKIIDAARTRFASDQDFGAWLTDSGYGDRITRHDRSALLNMAKYSVQTRKVLEQTNRRSWRLIWEEEIQPQLPSTGQPANSETSEASTSTETSEASTRRPKKNGAKQSPKEEWGKHLDSACSDVLLIANAASRIKKSILQATPEQQAAVKKKMSAEWKEAIDPGCDALPWIRDWANGLLEEEADTLLQQKGRVVTTPPHAAPPVQPQAGA
jgi:hypothetical protein